MRRRVFWKGEDAEEYVYKEEPAVERRDEAATEDSGGVQDADAEETGLAEDKYAKFMLQMNYYFI